MSRGARGAAERDLLLVGPATSSSTSPTTRVEYGHLREAHTDGDVYVRFPRAERDRAGGAVAAAPYPTLDSITGGWIGGVANETQKLLALCDADTLDRAALGPLAAARRLEAQLATLETVRERIETLMLQGRSVRHDRVEASRPTSTRASAARVLAVHQEHV